MTDRHFVRLLIVCGSVFTLFFAVIVIPPLIDSGDVIGALAAGFVNPYASGYSFDVIMCWFVLAVWVWYEASSGNVKRGWICLLLGLFPGVAVGLAAYLLLRHQQVRS